MRLGGGVVRFFFEGSKVIFDEVIRIRGDKEVVRALRSEGRVYIETTIYLILFFGVGLCVSILRILGTVMLNVVPFIRIALSSTVNFFISRLGNGKVICLENFL